MEYKDELTALLEEERKTPLFNISTLIVMFVVVLIINMMKGGGTFASPVGIVCGSVWFWLANVSMLAWSVAVMLAAREYLVKRWRLKTKIGYKYVEGDIEWDGKATLVYPAICSLAGFFAAVMMGAILSSYNSALNSTCTLFSLGLYQKLINPEADNAQVVRSGKLFGWAIAICSMTLAPFLLGQDSIFGYLQKMNGLYFIPILAVVLVGMK